MRQVWQSAPLKDLFVIKPPKIEAKKKLNQDDMVSFVPMNNLGIREKTFVANEEKTLSEVAGSYTYFADDDVLLAKITPCFENGKLGIAKNLKNGVGFGSSEFIVFRSKGEIDPEYLFYYLSQDSFRDSGAKVMTGAVGHKRVPKEFIEDFELPYPLIEEQKRIVAILDEAFAGIDTAIANTQKNLANARELFESYLLQLLISDESKDWEIRLLSDICDKITVGHVGSMAKRYKPQGVPMLRSQNIRPFQVDLKNVVYIDEEFHSELKKSSLKPGDLGIVRTGYPGTAAVIPESLKRVNCSDLVIVRPKKEVLSEFLAVFFNSPYGKKAVSKVLVGAAQKHFNVTAAKQAKVPLPSLEKQIEIVERVKDLSANIASLESNYKQKLRSLLDLKQSLLQKAFSGELTSNVDAFLDEAVA